ncbi:hypothetical protein BG004_005953 [Podila humilis]|nr:hypothetical protein BG004_005953 [Podila humilis]
MSNNNNNTPEAGGASGTSNQPNHAGGRSIFSVTMDPAAIEQEIDHAAQALHSTVNTLLNTMQSSVFGGLETLSREMSTMEKQSKSYLESHQHFPWSLRSDGPKKRYRITIEELPALDPASPSKPEAAMTTTMTNTGTKVATMGRDGDDDDFTITQGKVGTADEGKTVITASVAPGLLDWLLFTTHDDSFFRRLGQRNSEDNSNNGYDVIGGTKITELKDNDYTTTTAYNNNMASADEHAAAQKRIVPAIVDKVKQVGTSWEKGARHWWQGQGSDKDKDKDQKDKENEMGMDAQHHLLVGSEGENHGRRWPRHHHWESSESYSQTIVTRPDGTVETRSVNTVNGETETKIKIVHQDGSVEETVTRESKNAGYGGPRGGRWGGGGNHKAQEENFNESDGERELVSAIVEEAIETEKAAERKRNWPPKAWVRRHERD